MNSQELRINISVDDVSWKCLLNHYLQAEIMTEWKDSIFKGTLSMVPRGEKKNYGAVLRHFQASCM